jgi:hypothetical protein
VRFLELSTPGSPTPGWTGSYHGVLRISVDPTQEISGSCNVATASYGQLSAVTAAAGILAALEAGTVYWLVEIDATGVDERYGEANYASDEAGFYQGRLAGIGSWTQALADRRYAIESLSLDCKVADGDGRLSAILAGRYGNRLRNAAIAVKLAAPDVAPADWYVAFSGLLLSYRHEGDRVWSLRMGTNDLPLDRWVPRVLLSRADWPTAANDIFGKSAPIVLGVFDSTDLTDKGCVPTLRVDTTVGAIRYLVSFGAIKAVDRVYVDGVDTAGVGWTFQVVTVNGKAFSVVEFATDPGADVAVTVDCQGWTTAGDGSGTVVVEPVAQLRLVLDNVVYGDWKSGAWLTTTAPVDESLFAEVQDFLASSLSGGHESARYLGDIIKGRDLIDTWATSFGIRPFWTDRGKLGLSAEDHRVLIGAAYQDEYSIEQREVTGPLVIDYDATNMLERVRISFLPNPVTGNFQYQLTVQDTSLGEVGADQFDADWSRGHAA